MIEAKKLYAELAYLLPAQKREDLPQVLGPAFSRRAAAGRAQLRVFFFSEPKGYYEKRARRRVFIRSLFEKTPMGADELTKSDSYA